MTNRISTGRAMPSPSAAVSVEETGSATWLGSVGADVTSAMFGIARMMARLEYMTTTAMNVSENRTAFGRFFRGSWTSSAMAPALSNPTKDQPMNATATRNGPDSDK